MFVALDSSLRRRGHKKTNLYLLRFLYSLGIIIPMFNSASKEVRNLKLHRVWVETEIDPLRLTFKLKGGIEWRPKPKQPPKSKKVLRKKKR